MYKILLKLINIFLQINFLRSAGFYNPMNPYINGPVASPVAAPVVAPFGVNRGLGVF